MTDVAVVAFAQMPNVRAETVRNEVEMLMPVIQEVRGQVGLTQPDIGFTCSGSTDYLAGQAFSFVSTLDGVGPWPPIQESHVEMDGAWALYEAWVKLQIGEVDTALVYCYGKSAPGPVHEVLSRQLDPYHVAPLWPDAISLAALQARALIDAGKATEADFAEVAARSRRNAMDNPNAQLAWDRAAADLLAEEPLVDPLRKSDCPPITDGASRGHPRQRGSGPRAGGPPGVDPGDRPPHRADGPGAARPDGVGLHPHGGAEGRGRRTRPSTWPSCTPPSATRS